MEGSQKSGKEIAQCLCTSKSRNVLESQPDLHEIEIKGESSVAGIILPQNWALEMS